MGLKFKDPAWGQFRKNRSWTIKPNTLLMMMEEGRGVQGQVCACQAWTGAVHPDVFLHLLPLPLPPLPSFPPSFFLPLHSRYSVLPAPEGSQGISRHRIPDSTMNSAIRPYYQASRWRSGKELQPANAGMQGMGLIPGFRRSRKCQPLQYFLHWKSHGQRAWWATVMASESRT